MTMITSVPFPQHQSIAFLDGFGLTRVTLSGKVKSLLRYADYGGGGIARVSDDRLVVRGTRDHHGHPRARLVSMPDLEPVMNYSRFQVGEAFTEAGELAHFVSEAFDRAGMGYLHYSSIPAPMEGGRAVLKSPSWLRERVVFPTKGASPLELGGARTSLPQFAHVWPDGRFVRAVYNKCFDGLVCGHVAGGTVTFRWWLPIRHDCDEKRVALHVEGDDIWLTGLTQDQRHALVARIGPDGSARSWRFDAIEAPSVHDGVVGLCTAPGALERRRLDDPTKAEIITFPTEHLALDGGVEPDDVRRLPLLPRRAAPDLRGQVLVLSGALLYVPWHGETVLNPAATKAADRVIQRKLPKGDFPLRSFASRATARMRAAMVEAGGDVVLVDLNKVNDVGVTLHGNDAEGMMALCIAGIGRQYWSHHRPLSSFRMFVGTCPRRIEAAEVRAGLDLLARHGCPASDLLHATETAIANWGRSEGTRGEFPARELFAPDARRMLAEALVASAVGEPAQASPIASAAEIEGRLGGGPTSLDDRDTLVSVLTALLA